jgi:hypothetical protein
MEMLNHIMLDLQMDSRSFQARDIWSVVLNVGVSLLCKCADADAKLVFFKNVNPMWNLFCEESFYRALRQYLNQRPPPEAGWYAALNIVLAFAVRAEDSRNFKKALKYLRNTLGEVGELIGAQQDLFSIGAILGIVS